MSYVESESYGEDGCVEFHWCPYNSLCHRRILVIHLDIIFFYLHAAIIINPQLTEFHLTHATEYALCF